MSRSRERSYFVGYGYLYGIPYADYLSDILNWVYEDSADDGTIIARSESTGEIVFVEGSADNAKNL